MRGYAVAARSSFSTPVLGVAFGQAGLQERQREDEVRSGSICFAIRTRRT